MKLVAIVKLPSKRPRQRAPNRSLPRPRYSHHDYDHGTPRLIIVHIYGAERPVD